MFGLLADQNDALGLLARRSTNAPPPGGVQRGPATHEDAVKGRLWQEPEEDRYRASEPAPPPSASPFDDPLSKASVGGLLAASTGVDESLLKHYRAADQALKLTPEEQALYQRHLQNLWGTGGVDHPDGSRSTLYQSVEQGPSGQYHNIPTVWDGAILSPDAAREKASAVGWDQFPAYKTPEQADARYSQMHNFMERDTGDYFAIRGPQALLPQGLLGITQGGIKP